jgi:hypothetical protein
MTGVCNILYEFEVLYEIAEISERINMNSDITFRIINLHDVMGMLFYIS